MATATAVPRVTGSRVLYPHAQWWFLLAMVITWLGFSRSYFAVVRTEPLLHHVHGALMGGWIALLIVQPILYQRGKLRLHRTLGRWGVYLLVPAIVVCGYLMDRRMLRTHNAPPFIIDQLLFLDLTSLVYFVVLIAWSVLAARNVQVHARCIVCTVLLLVPPALARALSILPFLRSFQTTVNVAEVLVCLVLLWMTALDLRHGRSWASYPVSFLVFALIAYAANFAKDWLWWSGLAHFIANT